MRNEIQTIRRHRLRTLKQQITASQGFNRINHWVNGLPSITYSSRKIKYIFQPLQESDFNRVAP